MYYVEQLHNPDKHPLMPASHPWVVGTLPCDNSIEISEENYATLISSFDLTDYHASVDTYAHSPKIYNFMDKSRVKNPAVPPVSVDYVTGLNVKLHRKSIIVKGECRAEEFYETYDGTTYGNLIVKEAHVFTRNALGFATKRDTTITWYNNNGQANSTTKLLPKFYSSVEQIDEGKTRRGNLVNALQIPTIGLISLAMIGSTNATMAVILEGRKFLADYKLEFDMFVSESNKAILDCYMNPENPKYISVANYSWIDFMTPYGVTIRNYLHGEMNI